MAKPSGSSSEAVRVGFLLLPAFSHLGLAAAIETLFIANWLADSRLYSWVTLSKQGGEVKASNGMRLRCDASIASDARYDAVFVLASFEPKEQAIDPKVRAWLRRLARAGAELGAIETGSEIIAAAGLLDGHAVAVHWDNLQGFQETYPACAALPQLFTAGRNRLTCAGASSVLDMMLHWIRSRHGEALANEIAHHLLLEKLRNPDDPQIASQRQPPSMMPPALRHALDIMARTLEEPIPCQDIARAVGISLRQLQRLFMQGLSTTPSRHYRTLRLAKAHALLQQTKLSVTEVAMSAGFSSLEHFSRVYRSSFRRPPSADRRQSTDAPVLRRFT
jgi:AraC family transcriptional regulator, carnitine catabolism transcriptional activator